MAKQNTHSEHHDESNDIALPKLVRILARQAARQFLNFQQQAPSISSTAGASEGEVLMHEAVDPLVAHSDKEEP